MLPTTTLKEVFVVSVVGSGMDSTVGSSSLSVFSLFVSGSAACSIESGSLCAAGGASGTSVWAGVSSVFGTGFDSLTRLVLLGVGGGDLVRFDCFLVGGIVSCGLSLLALTAQKTSCLRAWNQRPTCFTRDAT